MAFTDLPPLQPAAPEPSATPRARVAKSVPPAPAALITHQLVTIPSVSPATTASFKAFESICGGRQALVAKLALVAAGKDEDYVVGLLADPRYEHEPLAGVCRAGKITLQRLMGLYRDAALVSAQVGAIDRVAQGLPAVAADVMTRSIEHRVTCPVCQGLATITPNPTKDDPNPEPRPCRACAGHGSTIEQPAHETQKTALELGGLLKKGGGLTIQQNNQQIALSAGSAGFGDLVEKLDEVLFGSARDRVKAGEQTVFTEAEVIQPTAPPEASEEGTAP